MSKGKQATLNPGDRVRFASKAGGQVVLITGTMIDHEKNNELRVGILPDRGQRDAGGSPISHKVPRFRDTLPGREALTRHPQSNSRRFDGFWKERVGSSMPIAICE